MYRQTSGEAARKIFDMHVHASPRPAQERLLERMVEAGISGGAIFSLRPLEAVGGPAADFEERWQNLADWTRGQQGRLFPVLWVHPDEPDATERLREAVRRGCAGFKMICDNYRVSDERCLRLAETAAELNKPVFFHSGILWNGGDSSRFNRPYLWEALLEIPNLRFSMGHCGWPWTDECLAVYGKFLNAYAENPAVAAEMFLDLTPGTPRIYREELLTKIFRIGYDVPHNLLFGSDSSAGDYNRNGWVAGWLKTDGAIYANLGVGESLLNLLYRDNFLRFLGILPKNFTHRSPLPDCGACWSLEDGV